MNKNELSPTDYYSLPTTATAIIQPSSDNNISNNFTTAHNLLVDRFSIEISNNNKKKIQLTLGDKICFIKPPSDLICDTIVKGHLPKRHGGVESQTVYVLMTDNKFDFYNIVEIADKKYK